MAFEIPKEKFVFMFPDIAGPTVRKIKEGAVPVEMLNGYYQLLEAGWNVTISDARWEGSFAKIRRKQSRFITVPSFGMFRDWLPADVIVVKDDFSLFLSLCAKLMGKKLIYLDAMFAFPKRPMKNFFIKLNLLLADRVICFSTTQARSWAVKYGVSLKRFSVLKYSIDAKFYNDVPKPHYGEASKVIAIGRDVGRDFNVLVEAVKDRNIFLYLITLPYLLPKDADNMANVQVEQRLSYEELMNLYQESAISIIPLTGELAYPSGIRAVMEAMALGKPVIATYTPVLAEYFVSGEEIIFVNAKSKAELSGAIEKLLGSGKWQKDLAENAYKKLLEEYTVEKYVSELMKLLIDCGRRG